MAAAKRYAVTAKMIVVRVPGAQGGESYVRQGRLLPDTVADAEVKRLLARDLIEAVEVPEPDSTASTEGQGGGNQPLAKPAGNAGVDRWTEYAVAVGIEVPAGSDKDAVKALVADAEAKAKAEAEAQK